MNSAICLPRRRSPKAGSGRPGACVLAVAASLCDARLRKKTQWCRIKLCGKQRMNGANGMSDMAGYAARVAVKRSGSCRDTMEPWGRERHRWANREVEAGGSTRVNFKWSARAMRCSSLPARIKAALAAVVPQVLDEGGYSFSVAAGRLMRTTIRISNNR